MQSFSRKTKRAKHDSHLNIITWGVLVVLIGMSSLWWWQNHRDTGVVIGQDDEVSAVLDNDAATKESDGKDFATVSELTEEQGEEPVETDSATDDNMVADEAMTPEAESAQQTDTTEAAGDNQDTAAEPTTAVTADESVPVVANGDSSLTMSFTADCWVQVKDATGKTLVTGIKKAGQSVDLRGKKPLQVILGAPEGVTMTFASEPVDLSRYTSGKVARFTLP